MDISGILSEFLWLLADIKIFYNWKAIYSCFRSANFWQNHETLGDISRGNHYSTQPNMNYHNYQAELP